MENIKDDRGYNQVWADNRSTRIRAERRCDYMISQMNITPSASVMEIGCGTGKNAYLLAQKTGMKVLGTDLCVPFIEEAKNNFKLPGLRYDILDFNKADQFKGEQFDYIIGNGILHHLYYHLDEAFVNMLHLLKPEGKIIFLEPNIYNPYVYLIFSYDYLRKKTHLEPDEMAFSKSWVSAKLLKAGYKDIKVEYKDFLLPGIPDALITPSVVIGDVLEKIPVLKNVSQSIFISAKKK
ncbi:MAG: Methyltransferase type 12 [Bacteroidota bacterium]|nr:Methyltransferase type 12 [Bacteroidota bacterium]